ncbi:MAG: lysophospholipid acyltransferase family protein [Pirellulales bacterium]
MFSLAVSFVAYLCVRALLCIAQSMRLETCESFCSLLASLLTDVLRLRRRIILENLRHAYPEWSDAQRLAVARQMWRHLLFSIVETAQFRRKIRLTNWRDYLRLKKTEEFTRIMLSGRPRVMVGGHFGNFELGGYIMALFGYTNHGVARPLDNPFLDRWAYGHRNIDGQHILSKRGDHERIRDILANGGAVIFLADQYAGSKGCWVEFFGRPASAHKAVPLFAFDCGGLVLAGHCRRVGPPLHYEMTMDGVVDVLDPPASLAGVRELTQWYTSRLEDAVQLAPEQYWWLHRRWKDRRAQNKAARRMRAA